MNSMLLTDGYKLGHHFQEPENTELIFSNMTPRSSRVEGVDRVRLFGMNYLIEKYLIKDFNKNFFDKPLKKVLRNFRQQVDAYLGRGAITTGHIKALHKLGYLPIEIKSIPEGCNVPINIPLFTIHNTHKDFGWLTNYLETLISCVLWQPCTSATIAEQFYKKFVEMADKTCDDGSFVPFQGHDFSFRGMSSVETAKLSGAAHLLYFAGTDTIPAISFIEQYYGGNCEEELIGCSVSATEHSVMSLNIAKYKSELETIKRLITVNCPKGIISLVSDTYDYWKVLTEYLPVLKDTIIQREKDNPGSKLVIRGDSGDPVLLILGDPNGETEAERLGSIRILNEIFGSTLNSRGYKVLNPCIGLIYGDSINLERQKLILEGLERMGYASSNIVLGIGSYTYQYNTRDTFGFAIKATYAEVDGESFNIYKDPATDKNKLKKSHKGLLALTVDGLIQEATWDQVNSEDNLYQTVFVDSTNLYSPFDNDYCHTRQNAKLNFEYGKGWV
jgi:nicotinamide phosphoribosyltransferase